MRWKTCVLRATVVALALATQAWADGRSIDDVEGPAKSAALSSWTPAQQYIPVRGRSGSSAAQLGYTGPGGLLMFADELGDKLSELGRISVIDHCFEYGEKATSSTLLWALCGPDVKAFDVKKLESELKADGISPESQKDVLEAAKRIHDKATQIGAVIEEAAKDDPGVAQVLKLADTAKAEWSKWLGSNKAAFDQYLALKDAVRSGKSNHKSFADCWKATEPGFVKLVKAAKFPWDYSGDYLPGYMSVLLTSTDGYIKAASFAACAYSVHESGEALAAAALNHDSLSGTVRVGWRTLALAKAVDPKFKPKFAERGLNWGEFGMLSPWRRSSYKLPGLNDTAKIMTPAQGVIAKVKKEGDITKLSFKGDKVDACLHWKETRKVQSIAANGDPIYERVCTKRGKVDNKEHDTEVATKFAAGLAPGVSVLIVNKYPVTAWKGKKFVAVFGVPKK